MYVYLYRSLSSNNTNAISEGAFAGLAKLRELNLQDNIIKQWETTLIHHEELPNLVMLNIAQNVYWKPDQQILSLPNLTTIDLLLMHKPKGYHWRLFKCYLVRRNIIKTLENTSIFVETISPSIKENIHPNVLLLRPNDCWQNKLFFRDVSYWNIIDESGFYFHCRRLEPYRVAIESTLNVIFLI
ncbi:uncharacterized protein LOC116296047 [Actinia tenebrosa]|uniref:Uncharacterized protein LOC116296047 n=1 Tax=Actinia tenebrosa TaxID=6105 RepID=A0A6P8I4M8_ACTTE|nr:uncharacterized protein LOC116296047 [Actinia tenebrosa]